ncbi:hypothetical protein GEMRC1_012022 [Eukaryota sp. GEM-RC1]
MSSLQNIPSSPNEDVAEFDTQVAGFTEYALMWFFSILFFPITLIASFFTVDPNEEVVVLLFVREVCPEGLHWYSVWGRSVVRMSKRIYSIKHNNTDIVDSTGAMLEVSCVVTYQVVDSMTAGLNFEDVHQYIHNISLTVLKRVISQYPYITEDPEEPSLKSESQAVSARMCELMQEKSHFAGIRTLTFDLVDLQYDPIIAPGMLVKQQASALLSSRQFIVKGATDIICDSVRTLKNEGLEFGESDRNQLISNLLVTICSDAHVQPIVSVQTN